MNVWTALHDGLALLLEPHRLLLLWGGVLCGLSLGILPGIGGVAGTALLIPFTYHMDPAAAMALLLGLAATTTHGDPISAIILGAPGHAASAATALDGYPMTKRGEGARALGAAYMSALMGGLFGAILMGALLPVARPLVLSIGSPELLALSVLGISMVAVLSGNTPLRGLCMAAFGVMLAMIGSDPQTGTLRWTLDSLYLAENLPLVPVTLGIFALPELCDLLVARAVVSSSEKRTSDWAGLWHGTRDCVTHWWLVLRCASIGSVIGAIPGIGAAVIDWISYAHALRTEKDAKQTFGKGDVRGVIAAESATCSREGGALIPTIVFGVPGSSGMAILLGAFLMHGLVPGPDMLTKNLSITYSMVWSIAIANVLGSGLCYLFSAQIAKLATLRYTLILPGVLSLVFIGAFEGHNDWGDLYSLLVFGLLGWVMKHLKWPRPPLVLGFILGSVLERYMFISVQRFGAAWMLRPVVMVLFAMALLSLLRPLWQHVKALGGVRHLSRGFGRPHFTPSQLFPLAVLTLFCVMTAVALQWSLSAKLVPVTVGTIAIAVGLASLLNDVFRKGPEVVQSAGGRAKAAIGASIHLDIASSVSHLPPSVVMTRGLRFFGWMGLFLLSMAGIGLIPTVPIFIVLLMRVEGREPWRVVLPMAIVVTLLIFGVFDQLLAIPWPGSYLGDLLPFWKTYVPSA